MDRRCQVSPEDTSIQILILWVVGLSTFINFGALIWNIFSGPSKRNAAKLDSHSTILGSLDLRLGRLEQQQSFLPSKDSMHELDVTMEQLKGEMKVMSEVMKGQSEIMKRLEAIVARHDEHLVRKT